MHTGSRLRLIHAHTFNHEQIASLIRFLMYVSGAYDVMYKDMGSQNLVAKKKNMQMPLAHTNPAPKQGYDLAAALLLYVSIKHQNSQTDAISW